MKWRSRAAVLVVLIVIGSPGVGQAQLSRAGFDVLEDLLITGSVFAGSVYLMGESTLIALSADRGIQGHGLEADWAGVELAWGIGNLAGGIIVTATSVYSRSPTWTVVDGGRLGVGIPMIVIGLYHIAHAIYSLVEGGPRAPDESVSIDLRSVPGGAVLVIAGAIPASF